MSLVVAVVQNVTGEVIARSPDGSTRLLNAGDELYAGELLITSNGAEVVLDYGNGDLVSLQNEQTLRITPSQQVNTPAAFAENTLLDPSVQDLLAALEGEGDLLDELEAPAAGTDGAPEGGGTSFTRIMRIAEDVDPQAFAFVETEEPGFETPLGDADALTVVEDEEADVTEDVIPIDPELGEEEPGEEEPGEEEPGEEEPGEEEPGEEEPGEEEPGEEEPGEEEPGEEEPGEEEPGEEEPGEEEPGQEEPGQEEPGQEEPGQEEPGQEPIAVDPLPIVKESTAHTVGASQQGTLANANSIKDTNHNSASVYVSEDGFYSVDHKGEADNPAAIDFNEGLLLELSKVATGISLEWSGDSLGGAQFVLYGANGAPVSGVLQLTSVAEGNLLNIVSDVEFAYVGFFGGSTGPGNSGVSSSFAVKPLGLTLEGTPNEDVIVGTDGSDVILGGAGSDTLTGGAGADTFVWLDEDQGIPGAPAIDVVTDFTLGQFGLDPNADRLDLSDLLIGEESNPIANYLYAETDAENNLTTLHISAQGGFSEGFDAALADQVIVLQGVNIAEDSGAVLDTLLANGQIQID